MNSPVSKSVSTTETFYLNDILLYSLIEMQTRGHNFPNILQI